MSTSKQHKGFVLAPLYGICLFILLYIIATLFYPGGSDNDKSIVGFSWLHNYWCELMAPKSQNNQVNTARPIAIAAMVVLVISLSLFWYYVSRLFTLKTFGRSVILYAGIGSMIAACFLSTGSHDIVMNIAGTLGCAAILATLIALYKTKAYILFSLGIFCLILCAINNYVYYTGNFFEYLAVIQKITFLVFLFWFSCVDIMLYRKMADKKKLTFIS